MAAPMTISIDKEMEHQYTNSKWTKRLDDPATVLNKYFECCLQNQSVYKNVPHVTVSYGPSERQAVDIFLPDNFSEGSTILMYIHGGYWQEQGCSRQGSGVFVNGFIGQGFAVALVGYDLCPTVGMYDVVDEVCKATYKVVDFALEKHASSIFVCGHSAGGHLTSMIAAMVESDLIKGFLPLSGIYDLEPLQCTSISEVLHFTESLVKDLSPVKIIDKIKKNCSTKKFLICVGMDESPELKKQSSNFHQALCNEGITSSLVIVGDADHFSLVADVYDVKFALNEEMTKFMKSFDK